MYILVLFMILSDSEYQISIGEESQLSFTFQKRRFIYDAAHGAFRKVCDAHILAAFIILFLVQFSADVV